MLVLYDYILSDDCYKVRLLLAMLEVEYQTAKVDIHPGTENRSLSFLAINPLGRIPVLTDGDLSLGDPQAILTYLAMKYDAGRHWFPDGAAAAGRVAMWLAFAGTELAALSLARSHKLFRAETEPDFETCVRRGRAAMEILEDHLAEGEIAGRRWVVGDDPTIADLAIFPPAALSSECGLPLEPYPAVWRWIDRVKRLPRFVVMPGILPLLPGVAA